MNHALKSLFAILWLGSYWLGFQGWYFWAVGLAFLAVFCGFAVRWSTLAGSLFGCFAPVSAMFWALSVHFFQIDLAYAIFFFVAAATGLVLPGLALLDDEDIEWQGEPLIGNWSKKSLAPVQSKDQTGAPREQTRAVETGSRTVRPVFWALLAAACLFALLSGSFTIAFALNLAALCLLFVLPSSSAFKARATHAVFGVFCLFGGLLTDGALGAIAWIFAAFFALMTFLTRGED